MSLRHWLQFDERKIIQNAIAYVFIAAILTAQFLKQQSHQAAVISILATLILVGGVVLWDVDRWRKAGLVPGPFWLHVTALALGALSGWLSTRVHGNREQWWLALFLQTAQMLLFFVLCELALDKRARKDIYGHDLHVISCVAAHLMVITHPVFEIKSGRVDFFVIGIYCASVLSTSIHYFRADLDLIALERRYVFFWAAASSALILGWWTVAAR